MPIPDNQIYPVDSVVRWKRTNEFGIIRQHTYQHQGKGFLNYLVEVEGKEVDTVGFTMT